MVTGDGAIAGIALQFEPPIDRPAPPIMEVLDEEAIWMSPAETTHRLLWDTSMCVDNSQGSEVRSLIKKACKASLSMPQQQFVLSEIEKDPKLVYHIGLTPQKLPDLVRVLGVLDAFLEPAKPILSPILTQLVACCVAPR